MVKVLLILFAVCFLSVGLKAQLSSEISELPPVSGKFKVGTVVYHWIDKKREEVWTKTPDDYRRLMVQIWYPADKEIKKQEAPYIFDLEKIRPSIEKYWADMPKIRTHATVNVSLASSGEKYPVIIFSHGMNSGRFLYTAICREMASHGYVVAAIDHTYWGPGVAFPDGKIVRYEDGMIARDTISSDDIDRMMQEGITVMAADQEFVFEKLTELNKDSKLFKNRLEMSQVGSIGHSMGGMAATRACLTYSAFKACVSLDGPNYFLNKMPQSISKPFLLLLNSDWGRGAPEKIKKSYLEAWSNPLVAIVNGTKHSFFSDLPLINPPEKKEGFIEAARAFRIISASVVSFFDSHLKQKSPNPEKFPEMEFIDLRAL